MLNAIISSLQRCFLKLIAPPFCRHCRAFLPTEAIFCAICLSNIKPIVSVQLHIAKDVTMSVHAVSAYKDPVKQLVLGKGWRDVVASRHLGELMWSHTFIGYTDFDCIVPIPLHWTRQRIRGYNQAYEIASVIATKSGKPVLSCLKRTQKTAYQSTLSAEQRKKNMQKVFALAPEHQGSLEGKHILLVDDLMTTGATLQEAAKALLAHKPRAISALVAARVV